MHDMRSIECILHRLLKLQRSYKTSLCSYIALLVPASVTLARSVQEWHWDEEAPCTHVTAHHSLAVACCLAHVVAVCELATRAGIFAHTAVLAAVAATCHNCVPQRSTNAACAQGPLAFRLTRGLHMTGCKLTNGRTHIRASSWSAAPDRGLLNRAFARLQSCTYGVGGFSICLPSSAHMLAVGERHWQPAICRCWTWFEDRNPASIAAPHECT